jgi:hypothetical protein
MQSPTKIYQINLSKYVGYAKSKDTTRVAGKGKSLLQSWQHCHV